MKNCSLFVLTLLCLGVFAKADDAPKTDTLSATVMVSGDVAPQGYLGDLEIDDQQTLHVLKSDIDFSQLKRGCIYDVTYRQIDSFSTELVTASQTADPCKDVSGVK